MGVSAIIAAFNEEETLGQVLDALKASPIISEIIVVSDGSTDATVEIARSREVRTVALRSNHGKGYALRLGVEHAENSVLFFVDGDMLNLTQDHITGLVQPVLDRDCDMNVGIRHRGQALDFMHLKLSLGPVLSGIRVLRRAVFESVPACYMERFKIELALNYFCAEAGYTQMNTVIYNLGHVIKEHKRGFGDGLLTRFRMSREVFLLHFDLYLFQTWRWNNSDESPAGEYELFEAEALE